MSPGSGTECRNDYWDEVRVPRLKGMRRKGSKPSTELELPDSLCTSPPAPHTPRPTLSALASKDAAVGDKEPEHSRTEGGEQDAA